MVGTERVRELLSRHGSLASQSPGEWMGTLALPPAVETFYREVGPCDVTIRSYGNPVFLPRLAALWDFQTGYRWHRETREPTDDWDDDWLAIAGEGDGVFIVSRRSEKVLHDLHGRGVWAPKEMFADLNTLAACLAYLGAIVISAGKTFTDNEERIRKEHLEVAESGLRQLVGSRSDARFILGALGWE